MRFHFFGLFRDTYFSYLHKVWLNDFYEISSHFLSSSCTYTYIFRVDTISTVFYTLSRARQGRFLLEPEARRSKKKGFKNVLNFEKKGIKIKVESEWKIRKKGRSLHFFSGCERNMNFGSFFRLEQIERIDLRANVGIKTSWWNFFFNPQKSRGNADSFFFFFMVKFFATQLKVGWVNFDNFRSKNVSSEKQRIIRAQSSINVRDAED